MKGEWEKKKMSEEKKEAKPGVSRRNFITGTVAGLVVGAAATYGATQLAIPKPPEKPAAEPVAGKTITLTINGKPYQQWVSARWTLLELLRDKIGLVGTQEGCYYGECGACTVLVGGKPMLSCEILAIETDGWDVTTIEGLAKGDRLDRIQESFIRNTAFQCGVCTPGFILSAKALLDKKPRPTEDEVREAISGNLCRCGTYDVVTKAILEA
jgi:aerobic-type carbon monoxide dehydrogenase small subunit (CoxS/CutS family)